MIKYLLIVLMFISQGCKQFPADPEESLKHIKNGTLLVGITHHPPFTVINGNQIGGKEVEIIKKFAKFHQAKIRWTINSESVLFKQLEKYEIHLVIGGTKKNTLWKKHIGLTKPYLKIKKESYCLAVSPGENALLLSLDKFLVNYKR